MRPPPTPLSSDDFVVNASTCLPDGCSFLCLPQDGEALVSQVGCLPPAPLAPAFLVCASGPARAGSCAPWFLLALVSRPLAWCLVVRPWPCCSWPRVSSFGSSPRWPSRVCLVPVPVPGGSTRCLSLSVGGGGRPRLLSSDWSTRGKNLNLQVNIGPTAPSDLPTPRGRWRP